jgi:NADPH-dependent glutamate synthase beta subunit-like oxidoreductase
MIPCQAACPVRTDAGRYVQLIAEGQYQDAYLVARSPNPLASICGRVCAAPCEDACRRGKIDAPVSIRALKRLSASALGLSRCIQGHRTSWFRFLRPSFVPQTPL